VTLRSPSAVLCDSLARRSRPTQLPGRWTNVPDWLSAEDTAHTGARWVHSRRPRAIEITRRVSDTEGSGIQPGAPRYDARSNDHYGEAFPPLAQSHPQLDKVPCRPLLVSTTANQNERPLPALAPKGPAVDVARMTR
jgi:hypothetical protein